MQQTAFATGSLPDVLQTLDADLQASIALSRVTLRALAALSPVLNRAADAALKEEAARLAEDAAAQRTLDILEDLRADLQRPLDDVCATRALQQALVAAAERILAP